MQKDCFAACCQCICQLFCMMLCQVLCANCHCRQCQCQCQCQCPDNPQCSDTCQKCCKMFFSILALIMMALSIIGIAISSADIPYYSSQKDNYINLTKKSFDCETYCGSNYKYDGSLCCLQNRTQCMDRVDCYNQKISWWDSQINMYSTIRIVSIGLAGISLIFMIVLLISKKVKQNNQKERWRAQASHARQSNHDIHQPLYPPPAHQVHASPARESPITEDPLHQDFMKFLAQLDKQTKGLRFSIPYRNSKVSCSVCMEPFVNEKAIQLHCKHIFHSKCIRQWVVKNRSCPLCRAPL